MTAEQPSTEETEEPSRAAGACALVALAGGVVAAAFAVDEAVGVLLVASAGTLALWRSATRRVSDSSAPPPPRSGRPSCDECAGHALVSATPSEIREGMLIYSYEMPGRPGHTHIHFGPPTDEATA